jgi:uncharacterized protein YhjY with autotransporter beta-barrel domain
VAKNARINVATNRRLHFSCRIVNEIRPWLAVGCLALGLTGPATASSAAGESAQHAAPDLTPNQRSLTVYFDGLCNGDRSAGLVYTCDRLGGAPSQVSNQSVLQAFDPQPLLAASNVALQVAATQNDNVMRRVVALRSGSRGLDLGDLSVDVGDQRIPGDALNAVSRPTIGGVLNQVLNEYDAADRIGLFANGRVGIDFAEDAESAPAPRFSDVMTGIDYRVHDRLVLGAGLGYYALGSGATVSASDGLDVRSWRTAMFGTYYDRHFHIDGQLGYDSAAYASLRHIQSPEVFGLSEAYARASSQGRQLSAQLTSTFDFRYGGWMFGPRIGASFVDAEVDPFQEVATHDYALAIGSQRAQSVRSSAGAEISMPRVGLSWLSVTPRVSADFVWDLANRSDVVDVRLVNDFDRTNAAAMRVDNPELGYFVWSVGAGAQVMRYLSGFVDYRSSVGADATVLTDLRWGLRFEAPL